jgi:hypothetical protein
MGLRKRTYHEHSFPVNIPSKKRRGGVRLGVGTMVLPFTPATKEIDDGDDHGCVHSGR